MAVYPLPNLSEEMQGPLLYLPARGLSFSDNKDQDKDFSDWASEVWPVGVDRDSASGNRVCNSGE